MAEVITAQNVKKRYGQTVAVVTHFMESAQVPGDRVAIIGQGRVVVQDTPQALIQNPIAMGYTILI